MKIDKNYALEILKKCEELYPKKFEGNSNNEHQQATLIYLTEEGLINCFEYTEPFRYEMYRISSAGLNLLSGQSFIEWFEENHQ